MENKESNITYLKKFGTNKLFDKKQLRDLAAEKSELYSVIGLITGTKSGKSNFGDWMALLGDFEIVNLHNRTEIIRTSKLFLPEMVIEQYSAKFKIDGGMTACEIAIVVGVKEADTSVGYEYTVRSLIKEQKRDALAELRQLLLPNIKEADNKNANNGSKVKKSA